MSSRRSCRVCRIGFQDQTVLGDVGWIAWHDAKALSVVGRGDEAVAIASDFYDRVQPTWPEAAKLKTNLLWIMADRMTELQTKFDYGNRRRDREAHRRVPRRQRVLQQPVPHVRRLVRPLPARKGLAEREGKFIEKCIGLLPDDTRCHHTLEGLNSQHPG